METPFIYGRTATSDNFTNRLKEKEILKNNFLALVNTTLISPRRWGKTSLVNQVAEELQKEHGKELIICKVDLFNCRSEEQFYSAFANAVMKATMSAFDEFAAAARKYLGRFVPQLTFYDTVQSYEFSLGLDLKEQKMSVDEILDLPQRIADDRNTRIMVCIDEFQNVGEYADSLGFQRRLRSHWQLHHRVGYCLYGSKRHLMMDIFSGYDMPFYKFGDVLFLQKIEREEWVRFIADRFEATGKHISEALAGQIADAMQNHPYYIQQYSQQVWLRTADVSDSETLQQALEGMLAQLSLLFTNIIDSLTTRQRNFLLAIANGETAFSSGSVLKKYALGTSANIKNLKKALLERDLIDVIPGKGIEIQDPALTCWLKATCLR